MPDNLLLHPLTRRRIEEYAAQPAAAILITGPAGSGKKTVAHQLAAEILGIERDKLSSYPFFINVKKPEDKQEIPIDAIRRVIIEVRLKPAIEGSGHAKRVILIERASSLSEEAQSALLKTLEEPSDNTVFILAAETESDLLPTIASRTQRLTVAPVNEAEAIDFFGDSHSAQSIVSAWQLSEGAPGLLSALLSANDHHPLKTAVEDAKKFLRQSKYDRVLFLDSISSDKPQFADFLAALARVLAALNYSAIESGNIPQARRVAAARRLVNDANESLSHNASSKLLSLHVALNLPL